MYAFAYSNGRSFLLFFSIFINNISNFMLIFATKKTNVISHKSWAAYYIYYCPAAVFIANLQTHSPKRWRTTTFEGFCLFALECFFYSICSRAQFAAWAVGDSCMRVCNNNKIWWMNDRPSGNLVLRDSWDPLPSVPFCLLVVRRPSPRARGGGKWVDGRDWDWGAEMSCCCCIH